MTQACAEACTPRPLVQLRGTVLRYDSPTDPVWPLNDPSSTTQQAGIPARRFGALAGRITMRPTSMRRSISLMTRMRDDTS